LRREDDLMDSAFKDLPMPETETPNVDFESLRSLSDVGIDVSFLESLKQQFQCTVAVI
jgi:hypothetical protein